MYSIAVAVRSSSLVVLFVVTLPCCSRGGGDAALAAADALILPLPAAFVLRAGPGDGEPELRAYTSVVASLGLSPRPVDAGALASLESRKGTLFFAPAAAARALSPEQMRWLCAAVERGAVLVTEEVSSLSECLGVARGPEIQVREVREAAYPSVAITWAKPVELATLATTRAGAVLTADKKTGSALALLVHHGEGAAIVLASALDAATSQGFGRYPYLPQALVRAGARLPFASPRLAAFFDYGYRAEADVESLAKRWRAAGIAALHVGAWDFWQAERDTDAYLAKLIAACHRHGLVVYAWLELPHVSLPFWKQHPEWRERTALGADAHLDWRYLMNLKDPACFAEVAAGMEALLARFDWDGVNLAEVYFDSPMGPSEPEQMTPFNAQVRREYLALAKIDPVDFFNSSSPHHWRKDAAAWARFVDYRVELERRLNEELLGVLAKVRATSKPDLGLALTYVDNLYDSSMREAVGADVKGILPLLERYDFTLIIEDPMTTWHLGPERYSRLAESYARLTPRVDKLGIDVNVVERWGEVYPTAKQTGSELLQLLHHTGKSFATVMVYAEQSIEEQDLGLLAHALAADVSAERTPRGLAVTTRYAVRYDSGLAHADFYVDGKLWSAVDGAEVILPAGQHTLAARKSKAAQRLRLVRLNASLLDAGYAADGALEVTYDSAARGFAELDAAPAAVWLDGQAAKVGEGAMSAMIMLPRGRHVLRARAGAL